MASLAFLAAACMGFLAIRASKPMRNQQLDEQSLKISKISSAIAACAAAIGCISLETMVTGIAAAVTFLAAIYFALQKPKPV
jgi:hypothetical protein